MLFLLTSLSSQKSNNFSVGRGRMIGKASLRPPTGIFQNIYLHVGTMKDKAGDKVSIRRMVAVGFQLLRQLELQ